MAFTREFIRSAAKERGVEIPKELEDALVQEHISARDAFSGEQVKAALERNRPEPAVAVKDTQEYRDLKKQFEDYRAGIAARETKAAKTAAARAYYESRGITGRALEIAVRGSGAEIEGLELEEGKIKDAAALEALVNGDFSGLVGQTRTEGAPTATPPATTGGGMTKADIYKKDGRGRYVMPASERQRALVENNLV